jgi:Spy/CpxP family protein refolding chaperone
MKKLLSNVGMVLMFCGLAMGQEGPMVTAQGRPGRMFMERGGAESMPMPPRGDAFYFLGNRGMHGPMGEWWKNPELVQKVGLNDEQTEKLDKISYESQLQMIDLRATLEKEQLMLGRQLQADQPDKDAVLGQVDKVSQARAAIERARVQTMLATRDVLTVEQWKKLKAARMDFHHRSFTRRGFRGHGFAGRGMRKAPEMPPQP